jgi:hypothetical protein
LKRRPAEGLHLPHGLFRQGFELKDSGRPERQDMERQIENRRGPDRFPHEPEPAASVAMTPVCAAGGAQRVRRGPPARNVEEGRWEELVRNGALDELRTGHPLRLERAIPRVDSEAFGRRL